MTRWLSTSPNGCCWVGEGSAKQPPASQERQVIEGVEICQASNVAYNKRVCLMTPSSTMEGYTHGEREVRA